MEKVQRYLYIAEDLAKDAVMDLQEDGDNTQFAMSKIRAVAALIEAATMEMNHRKTAEP